MSYLIRVDTPGEVYHFGVKGMRWGVRKRNAPNPGYSDEQRSADTRRFGKAAAKRINRKMNKGKTHEQAHKTERIRKRVKTAVLVAYGLSVAHSLMTAHGGSISNRIRARAATNRGRAAVPRIEMWHPIQAVRRGGAFNITTM